MLKDQCISVTDLRVNTKECLSGLKKHAKYIFVNNRPTAVVIDFDKYEAMEKIINEIPTLYEMNEDEVTPEIKKIADEARKMDKSAFLNI